MSRELGNRLGIARALAGLGLVASGFGPSRVTQAKQLWQEHLAFVQELGYLEEMATSFEQLAEIHNALEEYQTAQKYALEALTISKRIGSTWSISWPLAVLAEAAAGLDDFQTAWNYGYESLKSAVEAQAQMHILVALVSLAFLLAKNGDGLRQDGVPDTETALKSNERAIEILTLVMNHPAAWQIYKDKATRLRAALEAKLPLEMVAAAVERGKAMDLDETVREFLAELGRSKDEAE